MSSRRSLLIVALVVAAGFVIGLRLMRRTPPVPPPAVAKATPAPAAVAIAPEPTRSPQRFVQRTETELPIIDQGLTPAQAKVVAARYREAAQYPRTSRPLTDGMDPIARSRMPKVEPNWDDKHREAKLLAYPSMTAFEAPGDVVIYGEVVELHESEQREADPRGDRPPRLRQARVPASVMRGVIQTTDGRQVATIQFHDDGTHGDAQANDDFFTATYTPDPDRPDDFRGQFQVLALAETAKGEEVTAQTEFVYNVQKAHLTGSYRDSLVDGNLQIDVELEVEDAGTFRVEGTLAATSDASMVGYARGEASLTPGRHWIPMVYWGRIFHKMKKDGPYLLWSVVLSTLGGATPIESDVVPNAHTTGPYTVSQFDDKSFDDPDYTRKADQADAIAAGK